MENNNDILYQAAMCLEDNMDVSELNESIYTVWVYRNGKKVKKYKTTRAPQYKIYVDPETKKPIEKRIGAGERKQMQIRNRRGALKRRAKSAFISKQRERSLRVGYGRGKGYHDKPTQVNYRREMGQKVPSDEKAKQQNGKGVIASIADFLKKNAPKLIHPAKKKLKEQFLCETPWVEFTDDIAWDFCSEAEWESGRWLLQLVNIYDRIAQPSLRDDRNDDIGLLRLVSVPDETITKALLRDFAFCNLAHHSFLVLSDEEQEMIRDAVPVEVYSMLVNGK